MLRKSKYNIFIEHGDEYIVFNSYSGAVGRFDLDTKSRYDKRLLSEKEEDILAKKGILVDELIDEDEGIHKDRCEGINTLKKSQFRIWTTSYCNANCFYCFEKGMKVCSMTEDIANQVIEFIKGHTHPNSSLFIEWFGGEPLCNPDIIDYISRTLKSFCETKKISYYATMITNGSLITDEICRKMKQEWSVKSVQITLDAYGAEYNRIKDYNNPNEHNFERIIQNIKLLSENDIHISIRINYTTDNKESVLKLIDYLHTELQQYNNIFYYPYPIWNSLNTEDEKRFQSDTMADEGLVKILEKIAKYKMSPIKPLLRLGYRKNLCNSCLINGFSIYPDGRISKCSEAYTKMIGDVWHGVTNHEIEKIWIDNDIDKKCKECVYLPLCQGGCRASKVTDMPQCMAFKDIVPQLIKLYVDLQKENN